MVYSPTEFYRPFDASVDVPAADWRNCDLG